MKRRLPMFGYIFLIGFVFATACTSQNLPQSDSRDITQLMKELSDQSRKPSELLDPMLPTAEASKNLEPFRDRYEVSVTPTSEITIDDSDKATVPIRVHYKSDRGDSTDINSSVTFVRRNGVWYFSNFDFVHWNAFPIIFSLLFSVAGVGYIIAVLLVRRKMRRSGVKGLPLLKSWVPFLWPAILSKTKAK